MKQHFLAGALALTAASAALPAATQAAGGSDKTAKAAFVSAIHPSGSTAKMTVRYTCSQGTTLWISAKQSESGKMDPKLRKEGSSKAAAAWLESHRNPVSCSGTWHTASFKIDTVEKGSKGKLRSGYAWVQFCVTTKKGLTLSRAGWVRVL